MTDYANPMLIALVDIGILSQGEEDVMAIAINTNKMTNLENGVYMLGECDRELGVMNVLLTRDMVYKLMNYCEEALE